MTDRFATTAGWVRERLGATPRPIEVLVGIPALAWGVSMRARRRQGWWVCAFGTTATATATARLIESELTATSTALSAGYGLLLGLVLGYVAIRLEQSLHGSRGRRAMRGEDVAERRPEPDRLGPLH